MIALGAALVLCAFGAGELELRSGQRPPAPEVISAGAEGVVVGESGRAEFIVGWDRVLRLDGEHASEAGPYLPLGEALWRARTRLERGDAPSAEPMFERLLPALEGRSGPMSALAAEGLLRCRLRRGGQVAAIDPWLAWLRARQAGPSDAPPSFAEDWAARAGLDAVLDPATGLVPALPPIWVDWPSVLVYATAAEPSGQTATDKASAIESLYRHSARFECRIDEPFPLIASATDPGVALVLDIVLARSGADADRAGARDRLAARLAGARDTWIEAWCRSALGRSLIRESDPELQRQGIVQLLHLPARLSRTHPYLAGLALAEASTAISTMGDAAGATLLRKELIERFPDHPVLAWERIRLAPGAPTLPLGGSRPAPAPPVIPFDSTECPPL